MSAIYILFRSIRLEDNTALINAVRENKKVYIVFVLNEFLITKKNKYRSIHGLCFLMNSLRELDEKLRCHGSRIFFFYDSKIINALRKIIESDEGVSSIYFNEEYSVYGKNRERQIKYLCDQSGLKCNIFSDINIVVKKPKEKKITNWLLGQETDIDINNLGKFVEFIGKKKKYINSEIVPFADKYYDNLAPMDLKFESEINFEKVYLNMMKSPKIVGVVGTAKFCGGRNEGLKYLEAYSGGTNSCISPFLKFGCLSVREVYSAFRRFEKEVVLLTHDYLVYNYLTIGNKFTNYMKNFFVVENEDLITVEGFRKGKTSVPLYNALVGKLKKSGYLTFSERQLLVNIAVLGNGVPWHKIEKLFANFLVDYDMIITRAQIQLIIKSGVKISVEDVVEKKYKSGKFIAKWT